MSNKKQQHQQQPQQQQRQQHQAEPRQQQHQPEPRHPPEDMNKKMAKSKHPGLHTKQEGTPDNEYGVGTGTVSTGGSSDGTGSV
jgi:hypothetical protein